MFDSEKDEELTNSGGNAENGDVKEHLRVLKDEEERGVKLLTVDEGDEGEDHGEGVHDKHHLKWRESWVELEHASLPLTSERIETEEEHEKDSTTDETVLAISGEETSSGVVGGGKEEIETKTDHASTDVLIELVTLVVHDLAHKHNWYHLESLGEHNNWEADVLEGLVLAPAADNVSHRWEAILVEG